MTEDPRVGTLVGGYLIERLLGRGGMGMVYLAYHERLDRKVALKVLAPEWSEDGSFRDRFVRESRIAASLDHPNVIPVFDADEGDGLLFIAMRYVDGRDLKQIVTAEAPLDTGRTLRLLRQVAGALDAAHERGLVHRDVKPANILVTSADPRTASEHVYLTDFGLTKHRSSQSGLTATGAFVGTIDYIAPEQIEGKQIDKRTDIYSFGCILYECLTGEIPFKKETDVAVMYAHLMDPRPSVGSTRGGLPDAVDGIVAKAMARDPDERYDTAGAMIEELDRALAPASSSSASIATGVTEAPTIESSPPEAITPPERPQRARRGVGPRAVMLGGLVLAILAGSAYLLTRHDQPTPSSTGGGGVQERTHYAIVSIGGRGMERVPVEPLGEPELLASLLPAAPARQRDLGATTSSNGEWLLLETERLGCQDYACLAVAHGLSDLELVQVGPDLLHTAGSGFSAIASDGNTIAFPDDKGPHEVDLWATSRARIGWNEPVLLSGESGSNFNDTPAISPDGTNVLFNCHDEVYEPVRGRICKAALDGSDVSVVVAPEDGPAATKDSFVRNGSYAPDGSIVFEAFWKDVRQIWRYTAGAEPELINPTYANDTSPCVLPDGSIVSILADNDDLKLMSSDGVDVQTVDLKLAKDEYLDSQLSCS